MCEAMAENQGGEDEHTGFEALSWLVIDQDIFFIEGGSRKWRFDYC